MGSAGYGVKQSPDLPSVRFRSRRVGPIIQSRPEGLRSVCARRCESQPESRALMSTAEKLGVPGQEERVNSPSSTFCSIQAPRELGGAHLH